MVETSSLERPSVGTDIDFDVLADKYRAIRRASETLMAERPPGPDLSSRTLLLDGRMSRDG